MSGPQRPVFRPCVLCRAEKRERAGDGFFGFGFPGEAKRRPSQAVLWVCSEHIPEAEARQQKALKQRGLAA